MSSEIPILVTSAHSSSERRINPTWTVARLKTRLEPVTGIPASSQRLTLFRSPRTGRKPNNVGSTTSDEAGGGSVVDDGRTPNEPDRDEGVVIEAADEDEEEDEEEKTTLGQWRLAKGMEIYVR